MYLNIENTITSLLMFHVVEIVVIRIGANSD